jgi:IS30 family transposase
MFGDSRKAALPTLVERKTGYVLLRRVSSKSPQEIARRTIGALLPYPERSLCRSLTDDDVLRV